MNYKLLPVIGKKEHDKEDIGSLLRLFQSEYFTISMLIYYLNKKFKNEGINSYLVNKLYGISNDEIDFYITQLCYLAISKESLVLERYLLEKSASNIAMYLKIFWSFNSFGHSCKKDKRKAEKLEKLERCCEMSMVNGEIREGNNLVNPLNIGFKEMELNFNKDEYEKKILRKFQEKEAKSNYNNCLMKFTNNLIKISLSLKNVKLEDRKKKLKEFMHKTNLFLINSRKKHRDDEISVSRKNQLAYNLFEGMILPFPPSKFSIYHSNQAVRIIEDECQVFNTRKRVPYKIILETIDMEDLNNYIPNPHLFQIASKSKKIENPNNFTLTKDWEVIDENLENFDVFNNNDFSIEFNNELNKYQGLMSFAKYVEQNEKKINSSWMFSFLKPNTSMNSLNSPLKQKTNRVASHSNFSNLFEEEKQANKNSPNLENLNRSTFYKINNFNILYPPRFLTRRNSDEIKYLDHETDTYNKKKKKIFQKKISFQNLSTFNNLIFLDKYIHEYMSSPDFIEIKAENLRKIKLKIQDIFKTEQEENEEFLENSFNKKSYNSVKPRRFEPWGEIWEDKARNISLSSPYGHFPSYQLRTLIIKGGDDLRQELIAMQIIKQIHKIFNKAELNLFLRPYDIIVTSANSGIIEFIPNTMSLDELKKKNSNNNKTLKDFFKEVFRYNFEEAQKNFIESLAGYSIVTYLLNVKDRHNGNILLDSNGHLIHIDFGFLFNFSPGGITFESAPFKMTSEYIELMGGKESNMFLFFKMLVFKGFLELRKHTDDLMYLITIMMEDSDLPCFLNLDITALRMKFMEKCTDNEVMTNVEKLISMSCDNWRTLQYDNFQKMSNGILP